MEELLRRRGILSVGGVVSPLNSAPAEVPVASEAATALADSANATTNNSNGSTAAIGASPNALDAAGNPIGATPATPVIADNANNPDLPPDGASEDDWLAWLLGGGALAGGAAYAASKLRGRGAAAANDAGTIPLKGEILPSYTVNDTLTRVDDAVGSHQRLDQLVDGRNVTKAGEIGAGPKALSGPMPVTDVSGDVTLTDAMAKRRALPNDYEGPSRGPQTRMEYGARKAAYAREGTSNDNAIMLRDRYSDLSDEERTLASELAARLRMARESAPKLPAKIGSTKVARTRRANQTAVREPARAPASQAEQDLTQAVALVRRLRQSGNAARTVSRAARAIRP